MTSKKFYQKQPHKKWLQEDENQLIVDSAVVF